MAIGFLLLAHGNGCEEFEGLCCFNLSSHGESIHSKIQVIQSAVKELEVEKAMEWFNNLFKNWGLKGWVASILNGLIWILIIVLTVLITFACILKCFEKFSEKVFIINKEGGVVEASEGNIEGAVLSALPWRASSP